MTQQPESGQPPAAIDTTVPNSARIWNYRLGGKDHYEIDRLTGDQFSAICPGIVDIARAGRYFPGGLELAAPGVVPVTEWPPDPGPFGGADIPQAGAVGRKP